MAYTIYGKFPVLLPGLTETTSRNGLKFISGTIAYLPDEKDDAIKAAEVHGSLFPPPTAKNTGQGYWELNFQAVSITPFDNKVFGNEIITISKSFDTYTINEKWSVATITEFTALDSDKSIVEISQKIRGRTFSRTMKKRQIVGDRPSSSPAALSLSWTPEIRSITRRNFGDIDEADIVYGLAYTVQ